jgi:outer membrane receptor protein involved in Fe transport
MKKTIVIIIFSLLLSSAINAADTVSWQVLGKIVDRDTHNPIRGANVTVLNRFTEAASDSGGQFTIRNLSPGIYSLQISHIAYETKIVDGIRVLSSNAELSIELEPRVIKLKGIIVAPGSYNIMGDAPVSTQTLTSREIQTTPQLADDFFRAINHLPGMSNNDYTARFTIRGGEFDEILVTLDGLQLQEPFHLKDVDGGVMSIIDVAAVDGINLMTGGFPAEYGGKMSGVLGIKSRHARPASSRISASISLLNLKILSEGTFARDRGSWLFSARRGYIDYVLKMADPDSKVKPVYYDLYGKLRYKLSENNLLSANVLHADDNLHYYGEDEDTGDTLITKYGSTVVWATLTSQLHKRLTAQSIAAFGISDRYRRGQDVNGDNFRFLEFEARDKRDADFWKYKTDLEYDVSDKVLLKFGGELERSNAEYIYSYRDYIAEYNFDSGYYYALLTDSLETQFNASSSKFGAYSSLRWRLTEPFVTEIGLRYDDISNTEDKIVSPRLSAVYQSDEVTSLRAAWGVYYQPEGIDEVAVGDREKEYFPAEKAEHFVLGYEHEFDSGIRMRVEAYRKKYSRLRPAYRNTFDPIAPFPERESDRTAIFRKSADSKGIELLLKKDTGGKLTWWLSYALAKVEEQVDSIYFSREQVSAYRDIVIPAPQDQRHTLSCDIFYRPSPRWQLSAAFQYHSGWPYTDVYLASANTPEGTIYWIQSGEQWAARHKSYHRLDIRMDRYFPLKKGKIALFVELLNVYDHDNIRGYEYGLAGMEEPITIEKEPSYWLGILPSLGISYEVMF